MKKILNVLFATLLAVFTFSSCSDVPAPYEIMDEGDLPDIGLEGKGTQEDPYSVEYVIAKGAQGGEGWAQGYIVGGVKENTPNNWIETADDVVIGEPHPTGVRGGVVLLATDPDETDYKKCITAKLYNDGASEAVEAALSIPDNTDKALPRLVKVKGTLVKNTWGLPGLKGVKAAVLEDGTLVGEGGGTGETGDLASLLDPSKPVAEVVNTFDDAANDVDYAKAGYVNFAEAGSRVWRGKPYGENNEMRIQATAFKSSDASNISWLVTPAFTVDNLKVKKLTFDCVSAFYVEGTKLEIFFLEKNGNEVSYTKVDVGNIPQNTEGAYGEVTTLNGDLSAFAGKTGFIGFKYTGGSAATGTYQIDNLYVGVEAGTEPTPGDEVVVTKEQPYEESFATEFGKFTVEDKDLGGLNFVWKIDDKNHYAKASAFFEGVKVAESWLVSPVISLPQDAATLSFTQATFSDGKSEEYMLKVRLQEAADWENLTFDLPTGKWTWSDAKVDLSAYAGKKIQFAFVYKNENTSSANTWEVKNVKVSAGEGGTEPEPGGDYTSNIELPTTDFYDSDAAVYGGDIIIGGTEYPIVKLGTGKKAGFWNSSVLKAGATELSLYALGWSGKTGGLTITIENGGSFEGGATSQTIDLDGKTANIKDNPPFKDVTPAATDYYSYKLEGITASSIIKFTSGESGSDKRAVIFGINVK